MFSITLASYGVGAAQRSAADNKRIVPIAYERASLWAVSDPAPTSIAAKRLYAAALRSDIKRSKKSSVLALFNRQQSNNAERKQHRMLCRLRFFLETHSTKQDKAGCCCCCCCCNIQLLLRATETFRPHIGYCLVIPAGSRFCCSNELWNIPSYQVGT